MYRTYCAQSAERDEILDFLRARGRLENEWLIFLVTEAFECPFPAQEVVACRHDGNLTGIAWIMHQDRIPPQDRRPGYQPSNDYFVYLDAVDQASLRALVGWMPEGQLGEFMLFWPMIRDYFAALPDAHCRPDDLYFTVSAERFRPAAGGEVVRITAADAALFEGCERQPDSEHMRKDSHVYGILCDGRVASSVRYGPVPGTRDPRVVNIGGLYTETKLRRKGFGRRLVSYVTEMILREGDLPDYWTEPQNVASQNLAQSLGYWQFGEYARCFWRKPAGAQRARSER